jgi:hypothetical protein
MKGGEFIDQLTKCQIIKKDSASWIYHRHYHCHLDAKCSKNKEFSKGVGPKRKLTRASGLHGSFSSRYIIKWISSEWFTWVEYVYG